MSIGLPQIEIIFKQLASSAIVRSQRGIVALIVKDNTDITFTLKEYTSVLDIETAKFTAANVNYIKDVFAGSPSKVLVVRVGTASVTAVVDAITALGSKKYNWIGLAAGTADEQDDLSVYVKEQEALNKSIKAIVYDVTAPNSMHVVNFTNASVTYTSGTTVTGEKFIARLLGVFAGLSTSLTQSATYLAFADLLSVVEPADVEVAVNSGELVLFNDEETVRIARAVNSLTTYTANVTESMSKIIIVESMDLIRSDVYNTFKNEYLSKYKNKYDNQVLLISAINSYLSDLANEGILDSAYANTCYVDIEAQRNAWLSIGTTEAADWDDVTVRNKSFRSNVYLGGQIKILDSMEDFSFSIAME
ncbi:phage tail sheath C-terminal domain-containing protein [Paenibacillus sp. Root444D2]|uniref:phage tail sheath C-terminal domain-containing protein n=1 Tax=Paenibacillus sp. Root444D2 TaxID=1736538 RepID=UPI00070FA7B4|nr:phage tail sheath C-terminal domain-containing protein [Paenibacillus sp. Root444D2]KQX69230.1 hypothetical protein ASD40_01650 [Paenibacillus sp. Root444D2]